MLFFNKNLFNKMISIKSKIYKKVFIDTLKINNGIFLSNYHSL